MNANTNTAYVTDVSLNTASINTYRKHSLAAGILYLITFVSIPTLSLYGEMHKTDYILGTSSDTGVVVGGLLEIVVALAGIGTAVALYPVLRKHSEVFSLGVVATRVLEAGTMFLGVAFLLTNVTLKQNGGGQDALVTSHALVALYDRIFLLGQGFIPGINDLLLGLVLYKSRLVPRPLAVIGIAGALPLFAGYLATMLGFIDRISPLAGLSALPVAGFEFSLGMYLLVKGFKSSVAANK